MVQSTTPIVFLIRSTSCDFPLVGPIFSLDLAGQPAIVLNDLETITEFIGYYSTSCCLRLSVLISFCRLLGRRSNVYSGRPRLIMASEIMTRGIAFPFVTYNDV